MGFDVIPAIDLRGGRCVRLMQGDYARETVYSDDPAAMAVAWTEAGARVLHVVDLDGAAAGRPANLDALRAIRRATSATIQFGGGLRDDEAVEDALDAGADRVVLGTALVARPEWVERLSSTFADRLVVGIDARDGQVATEGWTATTRVTTADLIQRANALGFRWGLFTDIARDGMLDGPNIAALEEVIRAAAFGVLASGGVSTIDDLEAVRATGAAGAIVGTAIYTGQIDLRAALARFGR
jgi:phosphoribosylformimino-5-aminoimidazole carboxamide ribotide isomerase